MTVPQRKSDNTSIVVVSLTLLWGIIVSALVQGFALFAATLPGEILHRTDVPPPQIYLLAAVIQSVLLFLPLVPFALWWRAPRYRAVFRAWLAAAVLLLVLSPARLVPSPAPQVALLLQSILALIFSAALWGITGRGKILARAAPAALAVALAVGLLLALPWLLWGALGSVGDILFGILAACSIALAVTLILTRLWLRGMAQDSRGAGWDITLGGFVIGTLFAIVGSAVGFSGTQLLLLIALSALGWLLMDVVQISLRTSNGWNETALFSLIALALGAPLLLLDPATGILQASIGDGEMLSYALKAVGVVVLAVWILGLVLFFLRKRLVDWQQPLPAWLGAAAALVLALIVYFTAGQPGLFGSRVFVILNEQADVSTARNTERFNARRIFVYNTLTSQANRTQSRLRAALDQFGIRYTPYYLVNALEVDADLPLQLWLAVQPEVDRVLPSPHLRPLPAQPSPMQGFSTQPPLKPQWNLTLIGADRVWNELGVRGADVVVGQSDSGAEGTHPELSAQYRGHDGDNNYNWLDPWNHSAAPQDVGGHGTHTLGSIVGKTVGVAPDAQWIGCVNLARNLGNPAYYLDCMQFDFAPFPQNGNALRDGDPTRGAMVFNNSWGCPDVEGCDASALLASVRALRNAGIFVVASAGNDGPGCSSINSPLSLYDDVFSIGAVNENKDLATFSSRGPVTADGSSRIKPDIAAPGVDVLSSLPGGTYGEESGTSMAGPHVVGVVALMWSANPKLIGDVGTTEQILRETAQPYDPSKNGNLVCGDPAATPNDFVGYGIVDAYAAVKKAQALK